MIRLRKLYTFPEITKPIIFEDGLNFILGERDLSSNKTNGVGKSMSIEFLNFCLLRKEGGSRVLKIPKVFLDPDTQICLDIEINKKPLTIIRNTKTPDKPEIITEDKKVPFDSLDNALKYLNDIFYSKGSDINLNPSFRELINPSLRDERSEFKDIVSYFDTKTRVPADYVTPLYLLNFDLATYRFAKSIIKDIDKISRVISDLYKGITQNKTKRLPEVRAEVNSLEGELEKLENELEQFRTYESFEAIEEDLTDMDVKLDELRSQQAYYKLSIKKIRSLPEIEKIDEEEVLFVYEQFKSGLGEQLKKTFTQVNRFKEKVESFQNHIINEKLKEFISQHKLISDKVRSLDDKRAQMLSLIDKQGVFKNLKQSLAIYHQKSEESSNIRTQLKRYDSNIKDKNRLKSQKSTVVTRIDDQIVNNEKILESFNDTLSDIHNRIMGNRGCSFNIVTANTDTYKDIIKFDMTIDYGGSHSVERIKVFIYDLALLLNDYTSAKHPSFLVHDNLFDVDQDTLIESLNFLYTLKEPESFQYVLTLNNDKLDNEESNDRLLFNIRDYARAILTKSDRFIRGNKYSEI
jgi:uncharacterized protein YydD (DUF2326 family)